MRQFVILLFIVLASKLFSQEKITKTIRIKKEIPSQKQNNISGDSQEQEIYTIVDENPEFPGGLTELYNFIKTNLNYPALAIEKNIQDVVYVKFVINENGKVSSPQVLKGIVNCKVCDEEVLRVIKLLPDWQPGILNGKKVRTYFQMPIKFKSPTLNKSN